MPRAEVLEHPRPFSMAETYYTPLSSAKKAFTSHNDAKEGNFHLKTYPHLRLPPFL